jgi:hypothetical protein
MASPMRATNGVVVEQLSQAAHCGAGRSLRTVAPEIFIHTGPPALTDGVAFCDAYRCQSACLALETSILADERWTRWGCERCNKIDALCC